MAAPFVCFFTDGRDDRDGCVAAYIANILLDYNYMFLMRGDGTPYDILFNWVGRNKVLYPLGVVALFLIYICGYYWVHYLVSKKTTAVR
jgi:hypothetical protein